MGVDAIEVDDIEIVEEPAPEDDAGTPGGPPFDGATVDPRMRDRWVTARRAEGRRRLRILAAVVGVFSVLGIAYLIAQSPLLGADTITVKGAAGTTSEQIRTAARIEDGAPLLFLDTGRVAGRVEALPGVARARVETELPNTVVITVTERVPVAWTRTTGTVPIAVVDASGRVIRLDAQPPPALPEVVGAAGVLVPGATVTDPAAYHGLGELPAPLRLLSRTLTVRAGEGRLTISGSPPVADTVAFGPMTAMRAKGVAALAVLNDLVARGQRVGVLDVSVPGAPTTQGQEPLRAAS
jgi:cell division protein FtsQ